MADYKVHLGVKLNTSDINTQISKYKASPINIKANLDTDGITRAINGYKSKPISVDSTLNTDGITEKIRRYVPPKKIHLESELSTVGIDNKINNYTPKKPIIVDVELNKSNINQQIAAAKPTQSIKIDAELNKGAISEAIRNYKSTTPIKVMVNPDFSRVDVLVKNYIPPTLLKVNAKLNKTAINNEIKNFQTSSKIEVGAKLRDNAIETAIKTYAGKELVPIRVDFKVGETKEITNKINEYKNKSVVIPVKLQPAQTGFDSAITKKPVRVQATLDPDGIDNAIDTFKPTKRIKVGVQLDAKDVNGQVAKLPKPTDPIDVEARLNSGSINKAITSFKPSSRLKVGVDLQTEDINQQIDAIHPISNVKVSVKLDDSDVDAKTGGQKTQTPVAVNIKIDRDSLNEQIRNFKTQTKLKVGIKLDFVGIAQQIKEHQTKSKLKVGVQLDKEDIAQQVATVRTDTPVKLGVELDPEGIARVKEQIKNLKQQIEALGNVRINLGDSHVGATTDSNGSVSTTSAGVVGTNVAKGVVEADIKIVNMEKHVDELSGSLKKMGFEDSAIKGITKELEAMDIVVNRVVTRLDKNKNMMLTIMGTDKANRRNVTLTKGVDVEGNPVEFTKVSQKIGETERFIKQQQRAVADLTNQINQTNRSATDPNANRPIKDAAHLDSLKAKYNEIILAIETMGNASSDTFESERNKVKALISEYKSLKSEYKNAENVSLDFDGNDYVTGLEKAKNKLIEFKRQADNFPQMAQTVKELDAALANVGDAASLRSFVNQLEVADSALKNLKAEANDAYRILADAQKKIDSLATQVARLNPEANPQQLIELSAQLEEAEADYKSLKKTFGSKLSTDQFGTLQANADDLQDKLRAIEAKYRDTKAELAKKINIHLEAGKFTTQVQKAYSDTNRLSNASQELKAKLAALKNAQDAMNTAFASDNVDEQIASYRQYLRILEDVTNQLKQEQIQQRDAVDAQKLALSKKGLSSDMNSWLRDNSAAAKRFGDEIKRLQAQLNACDNNVDFNNIKQEFRNVQKEAKELGLTGLTTLDKIKNKFKEYGAYFSVAQVFMYAWQGLRDMFEQVKLIDKAMTELKKVTDETDASYERFLTNAANRAKVIGTTIDGLVSSTADFARLGYDFEDAQGLAEVANIYAVVGDEIEGVEGATKSLISTMAAFQTQMNGMSNSEFAMSIVDKFNEIGNNFAISSGGIGEALERSASSLMAANNTLDESIALITAANTVVQNPDAVGTAFKTISMRIRGAKTELEEAGLETEGMVESTAKLREEIKALSGVDIMEADGKTFKSTYAILDELAQKWEDLSDIQQATVTELIAGKRQGNIISSLMTNFDVAREALDTSLNSSGSAMKEHEKWQQSLEARINKLKASWQALSQAFLKSDFLKFTLNAVTGLVDALTKLIDTFGALGVVGIGLLGRGLFKHFTKDKKTITDVANAVEHLTDVMQNGTKATDEAAKANERNAAAEQAEAQATAESTAAETAESASNTAGAATDTADAAASEAAAQGEVKEATATAATVTAQATEIESDAAGVASDLADAKASEASALAETKEAAAKAATATAQLAESTTDVVNAGSETISMLPTISGMFTKMGKNAGGAGKGVGALLGKLGGLIKAHPYIAMAAAAIAAVTSIFARKSKEAKELAESVEELTEKYKEEHTELKKLQSDYDTSNESSMISRYEKLSRGVDDLGRNVSLTADEYSEYQSIVNQIAEQIPSLVSGYDEQGNAILSVKSNVEELRKEYEKLIHAQNNEILTNSGNIEKNYANTKHKASGTDWWSDGHGFWAGILNYLPFNSFGASNLLDYELKEDTVQGIKDLLNAKDEKTKRQIKNNLKADSYSKQEIRDALNSAGIEVKWWQNPVDVLEKAIEDDPQKIQGILDNYNAQFDEVVAQQKSIMNAKLSEAFDISSAISGLDYGNISEDLQAVAYRVVNSLDKDFFDRLAEKGESVEGWVTTMLNQLNSISKEDNTEIEAAFDLQTQFNGGKISYGEYIQGLKDVESTIDGLKLKSEAKKQLKISLGLDDGGVVAEYNSLLKRLSKKGRNADFNIDKTEAKKFLDGLTAEEFSVLVDIIPELSATEYKETIEDIKSALEMEMMLQGLTFDLNLEVETAGIDALNQALAESVSATGLSSESIAALKGRYADLELQGYDLSSVFEETSHGIRINRREFSKLEKAYATQKLADVDADLQEMKNAYDDIGEAIKNCDDPIKKSELFNDRQTLAKRISEAATLASQYEGLTSAYNDWLSTEAAGQERDMYENVIKGFETIDDEISRGWIDDGTIEFLEMLTGRTDLAGKSGKQLKEIYDGLDDTIKNTTYSVRDFFTVDEDGNSTNAGVYNFLDAIGQLKEEKFGGKDVVERDKDGNIIAFDFKIAGGDEAIADALGISKELVQIMVRAADDAGFVVSMDGTYRQLADLQNEAKAAADYLHQLGKTDFEFDFNTSSVENLKTQLVEAEKIWKDEKFWNKDGTFNFNADGATQAMQVVSTLRAKLDKLTEEQYGIGLTVEDEKFEEPLEKLQEYGRKIQTLNQLKLNPEANATEITELEGDLDTIAQDLIDLSKNNRIDIGIEANDNIDDVKKKIENGEIKIPTVLDIQANMDKNIETLTDLALLNSGLLSEDEEEVIRKKYTVKVEADEVDTTDVDNAVDNAVGGDGGRGGGFGGGVYARERNLKIIMEVASASGIKNLDRLSAKLDGLDDKTISVIAQAIGQGDVEALDEAIEGMDDKSVQALVKALGYNDVEELKAAVGNMQGKTVDAKVNTDGQQQKVNTFQSWIDGLRGKSVIIDLVVQGVEAVKKLLGIGEVNGTANVDGTAFVGGTTGKAYKQGDWRAKNSGTALMGELGTEIIVRDGKWFTVGDGGAGFYPYKKGDIIFNHKQAEQLLKYGKVTANGGRGKAFAEGTAFSRGTGGFGRYNQYIVAVDADGNKSNKRESSTPSANYSSGKSSSGGSGSSSGSSGSGGGSGKVDGSAVGSQDKFKETFDWLAILLSRLERTIDNFDKTANDSSKTWSKRNDALTSEITQVGNLITEIGSKDDPNSIAGKYYAQAGKSLSHDSDYAKKIRNGTLNIQDFEGEGDEATLEKIKEYQKWYELYLDMIDKAEDLKRTEAELWAQRFDNVVSEYDGYLQGFEHTETMLNEYISQAEAKGHIVSKDYYQALKTNKQSEIDKLIEEQSALIAKRNEAEANGIDKNSEEWYNMCAEIDGATQAIEAGTTALIEYDNAMRDIDWEVFDLIQERISDIASEANFLIDLMSYDKLFDDNGKLTDKGMATMGLHGQNINTYMYAADEYANEIAKIDKQIADGELDGNSKDVIDRRRTLVELQRESILAAEDEKQAIKDLVEEGINLELEALQERIDLHNEELDSMKDLYDYQKNVEEQTKNIASLQKQLHAYEGFDDEETRATVQKLKVELESAQQDLQETEYDKYIADQTALLDKLFLEYENVLNTRLDDTNALITQVIDAVNIAAGAEGTIATALGAEGAIAKELVANGVTIKSTLETEAKNVGTTLSTAMKGIWSVDEGNAKSVLTTYGEGFQGKQTTTNTILSDIKSYINRMVDDVDKDATTKVNANKTSTSAKKDPTKNSGGSSNPSSSTSGNGNKSTGGDGKAKIGDKVKFLSGKYYYDSQGVTPAGSKNHGKQVYITNVNTKSWATHPYHISTGKKLGSGDLGWLKLNQISGYATGKKNFLNDEIAWTQENGQEFIVRPSDGAILTPVAKGDSVLNAQASGNIWNMANNPAEFIKDSLKLDAANVPNGSSVSNSCIQNFENIVFSMPNVKNYGELLSELQKDPKFDKLIKAMTIDQIAGKSSLAKNKSIR